MQVLFGYLLLSLCVVVKLWCRYKRRGNVQLPIIVAAAAAGLHILLLQLTPSSSWHIHRTIVTLCRLSWHIFIHDLMSGKCRKLQRERTCKRNETKKKLFQTSVSSRATMELWAVSNRLGCCMPGPGGGKCTDPFGPDGFSGPI